MNEREKQIAQKVAEAIPEMDEFDKGYLLGQVEVMANKREKEDQIKEKGA